MENSIAKLGYRETEKKIEVEIFGLRFKINEEVIENKSTNDINRNDEDAVINEIDNILGENAVNKINDKRNKDGYDNMNLRIQLAVLSCIYEAYVNATAGTMVNKVESSLEKNINRANNLGNREQRRNYNRNRNNRYRRY
ncbi:MAG: hypothetical protein HFJ12_01595 [Bacilli bacterium]|nr:hypothetical protein [Bacilli bacterium]